MFLFFQQQFQSKSTQKNHIAIQKVRIQKIGWGVVLGGGGDKIDAV